jgi:hypothetical protein
MTEEQLKKERIDQALEDMEMAEKSVDYFTNDQIDTPAYAVAICNSIIYEDIYEQLYHYYGVKIKITKEQAQVQFQRKMRKFQYQIRMLEREKMELQGILLEIQTYKQAKQIYPFNHEYRNEFEIEKQLLAITIELAAKMRFANSFEYRTLFSISEMK